MQNSVERGKHEFYVVHTSKQLNLFTRMPLEKWKQFFSPNSWHFSIIFHTLCSHVKEIWTHANKKDYCIFRLSWTMNSDYLLFMEQCEFRHVAAAASRLSSKAFEKNKIKIKDYFWAIFRHRLNRCVVRRWLICLWLPSQLKES